MERGSVRRRFKVDGVSDRLGLAYCKPERHVVVGQDVGGDNTELVGSAQVVHRVDRRDPSLLERAVGLLDVVTHAVVLLAARDVAERVDVRERADEVHELVALQRRDLALDLVNECSDPGSVGSDDDDDDVIVVSWVYMWV